MEDEEREASKSSKSSPGEAVPIDFLEGAWHLLQDVPKSRDEKPQPPDVWHQQRKPRPQSAPCSRRVLERSPSKLFQQPGSRQDSRPTTADRVFQRGHTRWLTSKGPFVESPKAATSTMSLNEVAEVRGVIDLTPGYIQSDAKCIEDEMPDPTASTASRVRIRHTTIQRPGRSHAAPEQRKPMSMTEVQERMGQKSPYSWSEPNSVVTWNTSGTSSTKRYQVKTSPPPGPPPVQAPPMQRPPPTAALSPERRSSLRREEKPASGQGFIAWLWQFTFGRRGDAEAEAPSPPPVRNAAEFRPRPSSAGALREAPPPQRHEKQMWQIEQVRNRRPASAPSRREVPRVAPSSEELSPGFAAARSATHTPTGIQRAASWTSGPLPRRRPTDRKSVV